MRRFLFCCLATLAASASQAVWTQWTTGSGGNDHWYDVVLITGTDHSWSAARAQAQALVAPNSQFGDLATITSAAENTFVFNLANNASFWAIDGAGNNEGPYLGGFQAVGSSEPNGGWSWVSGEPWSYTSWNGGEPNNSGGGENWLSYFSGGSGRSQNWNDVGNAPNSVHVAYVVEAVPEPATMIALAVGVCGLARARRRRA